MSEQFKCPRCGFEQPPAEICCKCGINIQRYIEIKKSRNIIPSKNARKRFEEAKQHPGEKPSSEESQKSSSGPLPQEKAVPPKPPDINITEKDRIETTGELSRIGELFSNSWDIYKRRIITLILLYLLSIVFFAVAFGVFFGTGYIFSTVFPDAKQILIAAGSFVGIIAGSIAMVWGLAAFICAVSSETLGIKDALEQGSQKIWSFIWIFTLLGFIIPGGFFLFIIPGIIFSIWFFFSQFILAQEEERGMNALLKSKEYVRGYWFDIFLRLFLIWLISAVINMIPIIGPIVSFFYMPFMMIFTYLVYEDLKSVKGEVAYPSSPQEKLKWIGAGALGYILLIILIIAFMGAYLTSSLFLLKGII